jgi:microcystin-dependent protein
MAEPFLGEIRLVSFDFPTNGWALCNGQFLPINQNQALFALLGTQFGGNGQTNFALPDLRGRMAIHRGNGHNIGEAGGTVSVTLNQTHLPSHTHYVNMSNALATSANPAGAVIGKKGRFGRDLFAGTPNTTMSVMSTTAGGSMPHTNVQPYLGVKALIALVGIFPSQN